MESDYSRDGARAVRRTAVASARSSRWARPGAQALAFLAVFCADGLVTWGLGGPLWLTGLYVATGVAFSGARLAWSRRDRPREFAPPRPPTPAQAAGAAGQRLAVGYVQVPADDGRSMLAACRGTIKKHAESHALKLTTVVHDIERAPGETDGRPALRWALERISRGDAKVLVVARLNDLADTVADLSPLLRWFTSDGRALVAVDLRLDTSTEVGRLAAAALDGVGALERKRMAAPPPAAPAAAPRRRTSSGRAAVADRPELQQRIVAMREQGMTLQAIADRLNEEGVPTLRGGAMWRPSSVQRATGYRRPSANNRGIELPRSRPPER
jgi:DNA invertase Pin-like site-specific DNA recombinase